MEQKEIINGFVQLGEVMLCVGQEGKYINSWNISEQQFNDLQTLVVRQHSFNGWFTKESVLFSFSSHGAMLSREVLNDFTAKYPFVLTPKNVLVVMAGNLPLVGFHDFLCVLLSGNKITIKLSSDDQTLLPALIELLITIDKQFEERIIVSKGALKEIDAVIATGSDNSTRYFQEYFGKYPHVFRKNRTSIAVLDGTESKEEITLLGKDIFQYFGLGCRNVSHLLLPRGFDLNRFFEGIYDYKELINHHKYANNFDYNRAVHLLNLIPLLENGFVLLKETTDLHASLAMLYYHYYDSQNEIDSYLDEHKEAIQVVIGKSYFPFGLAQTPLITDFADNIDTMNFLTSM